MRPSAEPVTATPCNMPKGVLLDLSFLMMDWRPTESSKPRAIRAWRFKPSQGGALSVNKMSAAPCIDRRRIIEGRVHLPRRMCDTYKGKKKHPFGCIGSPDACLWTAP